MLQQYSFTFFSFLFLMTFIQVLCLFAQAGGLVLSKVTLHFQGMLNFGFTVVSWKMSAMAF